MPKTLNNSKINVPIASHKNPGIAHKNYLKMLRLNIPYLVIIQKNYSLDVRLYAKLFSINFTFTCAPKTLNIATHVNGHLNFLHCHFY